MSETVGGRILRIERSLLAPIRLCLELISYHLHVALPQIAAVAPPFKRQEPMPLFVEHMSYRNQRAAVEARLVVIAMPSDLVSRAPPPYRRIVRRAVAITSIPKAPHRWARTGTVRQTAVDDVVRLGAD